MARRRLWINRDYALLWSGEVVSTLGSQMSLLAYPLLALDLTGSSAKAGLVGTVATATRLAFRLPAGALVDRWDRRRTLLGCDLIRALTASGRRWRVDRRGRTAGWFRWPAWWR